MNVTVKVWGEFALFTRPELKVERMSYPFMTPSAARGVLDAILYKPQMRWHIRRITAIKPNFPAGFPVSATEQPYRLIPIRRNEIQNKISPTTINGFAKDPSSFRPYLVDSAGRESVQGSNRTQRNTLALQYVAYIIEASPLLTERANRPRTRPEDYDEAKGPDTEAKYVAMFNRRVSKGQCFHRPYLGCREFTCDFAPVDGSEQPLETWNESLGLMLYDIQYPAGQDTKNEDHLPGFFDARINGGVLHCDSLGDGPSGEAPVKVYGWDSEEVSK